VALTFDIGGPGFAGYEAVIVPALRRHHLRAIFFIQASRIRDTCDGRTACWATLRRWLAEGLISAESHTLFHQDYLTLSPEQIAYDAGRSKALIEARLGTTVIGLSYPFDSANPAAFPILAALGYRYAAAGHTRAERSALFGDAEPFRLPRYYPYSNPGLYPRLAGARGRTFGALMLEAVGAAEPASAPSLDEPEWPAPRTRRGQVWR
jgi:peptidoglycan/xylan/chitin deacetylase (PgdA/CDA1 family)